MLQAALKIKTAPQFLQKGTARSTKTKKLNLKKIKLHFLVAISNIHFQLLL